MDWSSPDVPAGDTVVSIGPTRSASFPTGGKVIMTRFVPRYNQAATGREPQARSETGPGLPTNGHADHPENRDEPVGFAGIRGDQVREALREDAARTGPVAAHEFPHRELDPDSRGAPGKVHRVALIPTMNGR